MTKKMSEIMLKMAATLLKRPNSSSSEAAHAALLFAHVSWNRANGIEDVFYKWYKKVLKEFENSNPRLWNEFKVIIPEKMIKALISYKNEHYPKDSRVIRVCGMRKANVHVEWSNSQRI